MDYNSLEKYRNYINSLENSFRNENDYGFDKLISKIKQNNPEDDFYDLTIGGSSDLYEPVSDSSGNEIIINTNDNEDKLKQQIENYIYNYLLTINDFD